MWDVKEPRPLFEKSRGRRPRWCGQTLQEIGKGWHLACMGHMSPVRAHSLWEGLCPEKLVKVNKTKKIMPCMMQWLTDLELGIQTLPTLQVRSRINFYIYLSMFNRTTESELTSNSSTSLSCLVTQADLEDKELVTTLCDDNLSLLPNTSRNLLFMER